MLRRRVNLLGPCLAAAVACAACGSTTSSSPASSGGGSSAPDAISVALPALPDSVDFDPRSASSAEVEATISNNIAGTLFGYNGAAVDPDTAAGIERPGLELASSATPSADGLTWTIMLRPKVTSQWGNPLTASDVAWTIQRALKTKSTASVLLGLVNLDTSRPTTVVGAHEIQIHLSAPSSIFEQTFALPALGIFDEQAVKAHAAPSDPYGYNWLDTHSATFGAYEVKTDALPNQLVVTANPHYWRGQPKVKTATYAVIADDSTRLETLISGQVAWATSLASSDATRVRSASSVQLYIEKDNVTPILLAFSLKDPAVASTNVRRAIGLAVNRSEINSVAFNGLAPPDTSCVPSQLFSYTSKDAFSSSAQVAAAKAALGSSAKGQTLTLAYLTSTPGVASAAEVVQSNLAAIGLKVALKPYTSVSTYYSDFAAQRFAMTIEAAAPDVASAAYFLKGNFASTSPYDFGAYKSQSFTSAITTALSTTGAAQHTSLASACDTFLKDAPAVQLVTEEGVAAVSRQVSPVSSANAAPLLYNLGRK